MIHSTATSSRTQRGHAFTLVEILVVVTILGISAALIIPQLGSRDDVRAASMARVIMADLAYAQSRAVSLQKWQYVRFDKDANVYEVLDKVTPTPVVITHPVEHKPFQVALGSARKDDLSAVGIDEASFDSQSILAFDELGTPFSCDDNGVTTPLAAGSVRLKSGDHTITISVQPYSGELRVN